jgi:hypothetical protein
MHQRLCDFVEANDGSEELKGFVHMGYEGAFDDRQMVVRKLCRKLQGLTVKGIDPTDIGITTPLSAFVLINELGDEVSHEEFMDNW